MSSFAKTVVAICLTIGVAPYAVAVPVTWQFEGTISTIGPEGSFWSDQGVAVGDGVSGTVTFDPDRAFPQRLTFSTPDADMWFQADGPDFVQYGDFTFSRASGGDLVYSQSYSNPVTRLQSIFGFDTQLVATVPPPYDTYAIYALEEGFADQAAIIRVGTSPPGNGVVPTDFYLAIPPDLDASTRGQLFLQDVGQDGIPVGIVAAISTLSVVSVPEAGTMGTLALGLLGLGLARRFS